MTAWRVLDCTQGTGSLRNRRGQLLIVSEGETSVPYAEISIVLIGQGWSVSGAVLAQLSEYGAALLCVGWRGVPLAGCHGWAETSRVGARHRAQAALSLPRRKNAWARIIREKIRGQARVLELHRLDGAEELYEMATDVRSGDPGNVEAAAARWYWRWLFADYDFIREPGGGAREGDSARLNACLDYGYTVLRGHGIRAVLAAGLAPSLGIFHRGRSNYFNLVDDLIEPFRPLIDHQVMSLGPGADLNDAHAKHALVASASAPFSSQGWSIPKELELLAQRFGAYCEGDSEKLEVSTWSAEAVETPVGERHNETADF